MAQKYKINYGYTTGDSYSSDDYTTELDMFWENLDIAKENLQRIKEHYQQYKDLEGYFFGKNRQNQEILTDNQNKDWFVKIERYVVFGEKHPNDYNVIEEKKYKELKEKGENVGVIISQYEAQNNIILITDNNEKWQFNAPWCGHFESLKWAEIIIDNFDMRIEF